MNVITEEQLKVKVPSIFSSESSAKTSDKYSLIPTIDCVRGLRQAGFHCVNAQEGRVRNSENKPYVKHLMRFRHESALEKGGNIPEIVMINSHNGACSYQLRAGIYRCVCANGLIVGNEMFFRKIIHKGDVISKVVEAAGEIIDIVPEVLQVADEWKKINLSSEQSNVYAQSAMLLKYDPAEIDINPAIALRPVRYADTNATDLWTTFNILQEKVIRGGVHYRAKEAGNSYYHRRGTTRAVNSVSENSRLNTALWNLTEKMAELARK
jgi:uncharacterized protein DUF932